MNHSQQMVLRDSPANGVRRQRTPRLQRGFPIVLTADRTLMAHYELLIEGMVSATQTTRTPGLLMKHLLAPPMPSDGPRAHLAPLGLRRIEAALRKRSWSADEVAVVTPESVACAIGADTRVIGISSGDPLGLGMNSTTMTGLLGGTVYTSKWFQQLLWRLQDLRTFAPRARIVVGGAGAWQLAQHDEARRALGIAHVVTGYSEANVADLFRQIAEDEELSPVLVGQDGSADTIPALCSPTVMGAVEISRGCGLGCEFCTLGRVPLAHLPLDTILADVGTNVAAGVTNVSLITEDVFRYGARGGGARPDKLLELLREMRRIPGLGLIQSDHANITSIVQFSDAQLNEAYRFFTGEGKWAKYVWLNLGVESASGELLAATGSRSKMSPYPPEEWGEVCLEQVRRLAKVGFLPMVSLVMGLPKETPGDVEKTVQWVRQLKHERVVVFPLFYAPNDNRSPTFKMTDMSCAHWQLFRECYELNFKWMPRLIWDNQSAAGVARWRRLLLQLLGQLQVPWWKSIFAWRSGRLCR